LRLLVQTVLRFIAGTYFVLTSLYCLLAFLPYTYCAFIKAPPYPWMPWFTHHQAILYWICAGAAAVAMRGTALREWKVSSPGFIATLSIVASIGIYLTARPFLPTVESNRAAYLWSLASLVPVIAMSVWRPSLARTTQPATTQPSLVFGYSSCLLVAVGVSVTYLIGTRIQTYRESHVLGLQKQFVDIALWSAVSHLAVAMAVLSGLNLIYLTASRTPRPRPVRRWMIRTSIVIILWIVLERFLDSAMSFDGPSAYIYALFFALTLTLWGSSLVMPFVERRGSKKLSMRQAAMLWLLIAVLSTIAVMSRTLIGGEDWNGFVSATWALVFWIAMSICVYRLRPVRASYSAAALIGTLLASAFVYKTLQFTQIFWSKPLGTTEDEISLSLEEYGGHDASFQLAHHVLGNARDAGCKDLCRILREYTNIRDTHISQGVKLVDNLTPTQQARPNIFLFVIDSMRPDYLGAYNPSVDYTPNLDALARDSVVFHRTYSQYAGTSISEPAIWAGAELLHTHFPQPFDDVNSLRTLARNDRYELAMSYDTVLRQLFSSSDDLTKIDTGKQLWNQYEACSTVQELETHLDGRPDKSKPVFFFAQPMNVHQFARNDVPSPTSQHWPERSALNTRITYEVHWVDSCLGGFVNYLKQRGTYENSIIIVTSDHGDATGELGRISHSTSIWPEIMHVPLIVHLPHNLRERAVYDDTRLSTLTDIAPTLYYLLGHKPIRQNRLYGRPLFAEKKEELDAYPRQDLLLASDVRAVYGILTADGRYLYTTYDSPSQSYLFDLISDPNAQRSILTDPLKRHYDEQIIERLHWVGDYYGYKPGVGALLASK